MIHYGSTFDDDIPDEDYRNMRFPLDSALEDKMKIWGPAFMRLLLDKYRHNYVYECPDIIKQYTDEYTDSNSVYAQFKALFLERGSEGEYCDLKSIKTTWTNLKNRKWGYYDICEVAVPKEKDMKEGFPTVLRTNCETRKKIHGVQVCSVFMGWKLLREPAIASDEADDKVGSGGLTRFCTGMEI